MIKVKDAFIVFENLKESAKLFRVLGGEKITSIRYNAENVFIIPEYILEQLDYLETEYRRLDKNEINSFLEERLSLLLALRK